MESIFFRLLKEDDKAADAAAQYRLRGSNAVYATPYCTFSQCMI
jgi:hypothetical protein